MRLNTKSQSLTSLLTGVLTRKELGNELVFTPNVLQNLYAIKEWDAPQK